MDKTRRLRRTVDAVGRIFAHAGGALRMAAPLGLGKPNRLLNSVYARVKADPCTSLHLFTALSLARPAPASELERRFVGPFAERHFGVDYPDLDYVLERRTGRLPRNVCVTEFYLQSGSALNDGATQRNYASLNYTFVARDLAGVGINVIVQLIARRIDDGRERFSLACNPDVTQDLLDAMVAIGAPRPLVVGVVHPHLPFVGNEAEVGEDFFDLVLDDPASDHVLFALPREPVGIAEFALGLHASTLVRDGGTLQIGIGALSDALVHALLLRHQDNATWRACLDALGGPHPLAARIGGEAPFARGLYGASEMVMDGFMHLAQAGILSRRVYDDLAFEQALADGAINETLDAAAVERLFERGALPPRVDARELVRLVRLGLLPQGARLGGEMIELPGGVRIEADLESRSARNAFARTLAGRRLREGRYLRGAFYLGSKLFYDWLGTLEGEAFDGLSMTRVSDINQLYGGRETLDALQRREARFFNTCMIATALGAAASDALEDGRVVSGVGGQYNFVAMAHALRDGRSVLLLRARRGDESNIRWNYGYTTIPRHLRDVYVTEYGVADLRGKSDEDCVRAMLAITDARFIDSLVAEAQRARKLPQDFAVPDRWRENTSQRLALTLTPWRDKFPEFPFGSDFDAVERRLLPALQWIRRRSATFGGRLLLVLAALTSPACETAILARLGLDAPRGVGERFLRRLVARAVAATAEG